MSLLDTASLVITPNGTKASKLYSVVPSDGSGDMTVTRATTATRVNSAGLIESVASNVPRLDYSNGTCPSILVEPQRTNIFTYSEQFDNAIWEKFNITLTANAIASPDGATTADKIISSANSNYHYTQQVKTVTAQGYVVSVYAKKGEYNRFTLRDSGATGDGSTFDLNSGTVVTNQNGGVGSIESVGNGWYRCILKLTAVSGGTSYGIFLNSNSGSGAQIFLGDGTSGIYIWGAQLEAGSYATSYIPTTSASVTRNADVISKTGISSLIGQTEGTVFVDAYFDEATDLNAWFLKENATFDTFVFLQRETSGIIAVGYYGSGALQARIETGTSQPIGRYKIAFGYKNNDFVLYINGTQIGTDTSGSVTGLMDYIDLHWTQTGKNKQNNVVLWKTRLTNTQLAQLTTI